MATPCFFLHGEQPAVDNLDVTPLDLSPASHAAYLWEKAQRLNAQQADLEASTPS